MIFYAHRGNTRGPSMFENEPYYLTRAINEGFAPEVDVWCVKGDLWFGHDWPDHRVTQEWMQDFGEYCIFHCKNWQAMLAMQQAKQHYFWHQDDEYTLTSEGLVWVYPDRPFQPDKNYIACQPGYIDLPAEWYDIGGICSDYVYTLRMKKEALCPTK